MRALLSLLLAITLLATVSRAALSLDNDGIAADPLLDRASPRATMDGFLQAGAAGQYRRAAQFLDLRSMSSSQQASEGPGRAEQLYYVLTRELTVDLGKIPADSAGDADPQSKPVVAATVRLGEEPVAISLVRVRFDDGAFRWLISKTTIAMVPTLYAAFGPRGWQAYLPAILVKYTLFGNEAWQWLALWGGAVLCYAVGMALSAALWALFHRLLGRTPVALRARLREASRPPLRLLVAVSMYLVLVDELQLTAGIERLFVRVSYSLLVVGVAWLLISILGTGSLWLQQELVVDTAREAESRGARTKLSLLRRILTIIVFMLAAALLLMQFDFVRNIGMSLLASAGIAGVVLGFAAQKSLAGVIAGIQLLITQPVRIGDTVVVEKEFGQIEEMNLTYVVVRLWDKRRLILPIARLLEYPFENWTRVTPEIVGTVMLAVDYATPVQALRTELARICHDHRLWDGKTCVLQVTDVGERCMVLRALVSSFDASSSWDLRCEVRERLIAFVRDLEQGRYLVRSRDDVTRGPDPASRPSNRGAAIARTSRAEEA